MLYHTKVFMPEHIRRLVPAGERPLHYTRHALNESRLDKWGRVELPRKADISQWELIEVETLSDKTKFVVQRPVNADVKLSLVALLERGQLIVKTVWLNEMSDTHATLNRSRYAKS